jgi:rhodanese-related sulfurtransferase
MSDTANVAPPPASTAPARAPAAFSFVLEYPPADPEAARRHFAAKLSVETDPYDVKTDLDRNPNAFVLADVRTADAYRECHAVGAINLPARQINAETTRHLDKRVPVVTYCYGPGCNSSTKAALRLAVLGFQVKEMIGGIEYWRHQGFPIEGTLGAAASLYD